MESKSYRELPIFVKSEEILEMISRFVEVLNSQQNEFLELQISILVENSILIPAKIAGAEGVDVYDIKMENATLIRKAAREIFVSVGALEFFGIETEEEYVQLIRNEIEEFKILFRDWVKSFDPWNYILDDWGLFNPPGIEPQ